MQAPTFAGTQLSTTSSNKHRTVLFTSTTASFMTLSRFKGCSLRVLGRTNCRELVASCSRRQVPTSLRARPPHTHTPFYVLVLTRLKDSPRNKQMMAYKSAAGIFVMMAAVAITGCNGRDDHD